MFVLLLIKTYFYYTNIIFTLQILFLYCTSDGERMQVDNNQIALQTAHFPLCAPYGVLFHQDSTFCDQLPSVTLLPSDGKK